MKRLSQEVVYKHYKESGYILQSIYKGGKYKDKLSCQLGHDIEMRFSDFSRGHRCVKCSGKAKHTHDEVYEYYKNNGYILNSIYKGSSKKDQLTCPVGHKIEIKYNSFKNQKSRCVKCAGLNKYSQEEVYNEYKKYDYILNSIYVNCSTKDRVTCPVGHHIEIRLDCFKNSGHRCRVCHYNNIFHKNNPNFNPNREEIDLNKRLRRTRSKEWITNHMISDPNYSKFISNPSDYILDHIIPIKLFCQLHTKYNLDEIRIKQIINKIDNLQLLTKNENLRKGSRGSSKMAERYLIENGIDLITS